MIRGTTPTLEFFLPFDTGVLAEAYITFAQGGEVVLEKTLNDCEAVKNVLSIKLTQAETLALKAGSFTEIQIKAKTTDGDVIASNIMRESTERILKEDEI